MCYDSQQFGHIACECQNPTVPHRNGQKFPITPAQGFNVHAQTFTPVQYHSTAPLMSQQIMPGPMPFFQSG